MHVSALLMVSEGGNVFRLYKIKTRLGLTIQNAYHMQKYCS